MSILGKREETKNRQVLSCHDFFLMNFACPLSLSLQKILLSQSRTCSLKNRGKEKIGHVFSGLDVWK